LQPLKITIYGEYWDSYLYSGRLYLFNLDGSLSTINWDKLVQQYIQDEQLRIVIEAAFSRSDYLYGKNFKAFFSDQDIKNLLMRKITRAALLDFELTLKQRAALEVRTQDNPFPFPHTDIAFYINKVYSASADGLYRSSSSKKNKFPIKRKADLLWDCPVLSIAAAYFTVALAAGGEGLFEYFVDDPDGDLFEKPNSNPMQRQHQDCTACSWAFHSIFGSSHIENSFLAQFSRNSNDSERHRSFVGTLSSENIFHQQGYSWANSDKFCQAIKSGIKIIRYNPWSKDNQFIDLGTLNFDTLQGEIVSGGIASFGIIIELEKSVVVLSSDGETFSFPGEPIRWRVYPRSKYYTNQLHIIYDNRLEICSFNHDYFVDQANKKIGSRVF
jgi:hypothetical protein